MDEKPLLASGNVVSDYRPLIVYWKKAVEKGLKKASEEIVLRQEDFKKAEELARENLSLTETLNKLEDFFLPRVNPVLALEAFKEVYGFNIREEDARRHIARIMAGWLIEASEQLGILKMRRGRSAKNT